MPRYVEYINKIDIGVGKMVCAARMAAGMSRQELAEKIEVTHQQLQKYESGENRLTVGRLYFIAIVLNKPMEYFYTDIFPDHKNQEIIETSSQRKCLEVSRNFMRIRNEEYQNAISFLVRKLASNGLSSEENQSFNVVSNENNNK